MIPSKTLSAPNTTAHANAPAENQNGPQAPGENTPPVVVVRQVSTQDAVLPVEAEKPMPSTRPALVVREPAENRQRFFVTDGVWLKNEPRIVRFLSRLNQRDEHNETSLASRGNEDNLIRSSHTDQNLLRHSARLLTYFNHLEFDSDDQKYKFLLYLAKTSPRDCAEYFHRFALSDPEQIFEIAMLCAQHEDFLKYFDNFNIESENNRISLAMRCCSVNPKIFGNYMQAFRIPDPGMHLGIAMQLAEEVPNYLCKYIHNFDIPDEDDRIRLAKKCARQAGVSLANHIKKFSISDESARFSIAKTCLKCMMIRAPESYESLNNFQISDPEKHKVFIKAMVQNLSSDDDWACLFDYLKNGPGKNHPASALIDAYLTYKANDRELVFEEGATDLIKDLLTGASHNPNHLYLYTLSEEDLQETLEANEYVVTNNTGLSLSEVYGKTSDDDEKIKLCQWVRDVVFYIDTRKIGSDVIHSVLKPVFKKIIKFKDENYRSYLITHIFSSEKNMLSKTELDQFPPDAQIPALIVASMTTPGFNAFLKKTAAGIMKDGFYQRQLIEGICSLKNTSAMNDELQEIMTIIFPENSLEMNADKTGEAQEYSAKERRMMKKNNAARADRIEKFNQVLNVFSKLCIIINFEEEYNINQISDLSQIDGKIRKITKNNFKLSDEDYIKFSEKFYSYRDSMSLLTYLFRIRHLKIAQVLTEFAGLVLEDKFLAERYKRSEIFNLCEPHLQDAWKRNIVSPRANMQALMFTDEHQDLIRMGSDVRGSCQRIDGDPVLNRGLIGAVMDGSEKLCVLKDKSGKILQRCILRLMWATPAASTDRLDPQGSPCLFMEAIYPPNLNIQSKASLIDFVHEQANRLGLPLAMADDEDDLLKPLLSTQYQLTPTDKIMYSGAIHVPLYSDAENGIQERAFSIAPSRGGNLNWLN